jgi:cobalamin biosynthesis Co2+ chelatase CbiK
MSILHIVADKLAILVGHGKGKRSEVVYLSVQLPHLLHQSCQTVFIANLAALRNMHNFLIRLGSGVVSHGRSNEFYLIDSYL